MRMIVRGIAIFLEAVREERESMRRTGAKIEATSEVRRWQILAIITFAVGVLAPALWFGQSTFVVNVHPKGGYYISAAMCYTIFALARILFVSFPISGDGKPIPPDIKKIRASMMYAVPVLGQIVAAFWIIGLIWSSLRMFLRRA